MAEQYIRIKGGNKMFPKGTVATVKRDLTKETVVTDVWDDYRERYAVVKRSFLQNKKLFQQIDNSDDDMLQLLLLKT